MKNRQHPIVILKYMTLNFWLLAIPLVRASFPLVKSLLAGVWEKEQWTAWLRGTYIDIIVLLLIILIAYLRWLSVKFEFNEKGFYYNGGLFLKLEYYLPYSIISSINTKRNIWYRLFRAVYVYVDSPTRSPLNKKDDSDVHIITSKKMLDETFGKLPEYANINAKTKSAKTSYQASKRDMLFFSFVFSSTLTGVIFFSALFTQSGKIVQNQLETRFNDTVAEVTDRVNTVVSGVTPVAVGVSLVIAGGWLLSFITNLLRHLPFKVERKGESITVENGLLTKRKCYINSNKINYTDIRQNLLMKIFKVMSVHISCSGYGSFKREIPVILPITTSNRIISSLRLILPKFAPLESTVKSSMKYKWAFIGLPIFLIVLAYIVGYIAVLIFPEWYNIISYLLVMTEVALLYILIVKYVSIHTSGIAESDAAIHLKYCKGAEFHEVTVAKSRIAFTRIRQNPFQRKNGSCDYFVYANEETKKKHKVKGLTLSELGVRSWK